MKQGEQANLPASLHLVLQVGLKPTDKLRKKDKMTYEYNKLSSGKGK